MNCGEVCRCCAARRCCMPHADGMRSQWVFAGATRRRAELHLERGGERAPPTRVRGGDSEADVGARARRRRGDRWSPCAMSPGGRGEGGGGQDCRTTWSSCGEEDAVSRRAPQSRARPRLSVIPVAPRRSAAAAAAACGASARLLVALRTCRRATPMRVFVPMGVQGGQAILGAHAVWARQGDGALAPSAPSVRPRSRLSRL